MTPSYQQDTQSILEAIKRELPHLSGQQQKIGLFLLEHSEVLGLLSISELATRAEVSESTIIRFCRALGYKGFLEFSRSVQRVVEKEISHAGYFRDSLDAERAAPLQKVSKTLVETDLANLTRLSQNFPSESVRLVVEHMLRCERISILGRMSAYPLTIYFEQLLSKITDKVEILSNSEVIQAATVARMNENSLVFCIAFPRYPRTIVQLAAIAKSKGATVIGITNNELSPIAQYSDVLLPMPVSIVSYIDLVTPVMTLINVICTEFGHAQHDTTERRLRDYDAIVSDVFFWKKNTL
jgi:Transcriptional regulators